MADVQTGDLTKKGTDAMYHVIKLDKAIHKYEDKNGRIVMPGDILEFSDGSIEVAILAEGTNTEYDLGINASNRGFLEHHPNWAPEVYPLSNFRRSEYEVIGHEEE